MDTLSQYKIVTITHKSTALKNIGQFVLPNVDTEAAFKERMQSIKELLGLEELLYVATCNRVLFLCVTQDALDTLFIQKIQNIVYPNLDLNLEEAAATFEGQAAIQHLLEVSSSADSLVIGEREILRQLREAYAQCYEAGLTSDFIRIAIRLAVETAKKAYSETRIGEKAVSVVSLAIRQLLARNPSKSSRFLIVGAGQTNTLVGKFLLKYGFSNFTVFNRSMTNAQQLAKMLQGEAHLLENLADYQKGFDILIACTGATNAIVTKPIYQKILQDKDSKILIDLAIPNNIEATVTTDFDTDYIEIDGLNELINENIAFRKKEVAKVLAIIAEQIEAFKKIYKSRQIELALQDVPRHIKAIKHHAIDKVFKEEVSSLDANAQELIERMMAYMEKRCIAIPMQVAKENLGGVTSIKKIKLESL